MGKRVVRIIGQAVAEKLPELLNTEINIILKSGITLHGVISSYDFNSLQLKDMILRKHHIHLIDIEEVAVDKVSKY